MTILVDLWPYPVGATRYAENGSIVPPDGISVAMTKYYVDLILQGYLYTWDPREEPGGTPTPIPGGGGAAIPTYATAALLGLAVGASNGAVACTSGCLDSNDGGGGIWFWDSNSTTDEDVGLCMGASALGRWKRSYSGGVNPRWFGAKGDGANDDTTAIQAAVDAASNPLSNVYLSNNAEVYISSGKYRLSGTLSLRIGSKLRGDSAMSTHLEWDRNNSTPGLQVNNGDSGSLGLQQTVISNLTIRGFWTDANLNRAAGQPATLARSSNHVGLLWRSVVFAKIFDCTIDGWAWGIVQDCVNNTRVENCVFVGGATGATSPATVKAVAIMLAPTSNTDYHDTEYPNFTATTPSYFSLANICEVVSCQFNGYDVALWHNGGVNHSVKDCNFYSNYVAVIITSGQEINYAENYYEGGLGYGNHVLRRRFNVPAASDAVVGFSLSNMYVVSNPAIPTVYVEAGASISGRLKLSGYINAAPQTTLIRDGVTTVPGSAVFLEPAYGAYLPGALTGVLQNDGVNVNRNLSNPAGVLINDTPRGDSAAASLGSLHMSSCLLDAKPGNALLQMLPMSKAGAAKVIISKRVRQYATDLNLTPVKITIPATGLIDCTATFLANFIPYGECATYQRRILASRTFQSAVQTPNADLSAFGGGAPASIATAPSIVMVGNNLEFRVTMTGGSFGAESYIEWHVVVEAITCESAYTIGVATTNAGTLTWAGEVSLASTT